jgi:uncharacterized protein YbjT (DUF2867 family)
LTGEDILIIGGSGTLGSRLVRQLAAGGIRPRVLTRTQETADALASLAAPVVGDLLAPESLEAAFRGVERVFVLGQPTPDMEALERNAIDAAVASGARRIVYLSNFTARVGSDLRPNHIHAVHERLVASLGIEWTVLGPTRYMTNFPFDWASVLNDGLLLETGGSGVMTCIDPDDVAEVAVKVLTEAGHDGQTYRLTSEDSFTAASLAALLSDVVGRDVRVAEGVPAAGYFKLVAAGMYVPTNTASMLLGRAPRTYRDWLRRNAPTLIARENRRAGVDSR